MRKLYSDIFIPVKYMPLMHLSNYVFEIEICGQTCDALTDMMEYEWIISVMVL